MASSPRLRGRRILLTGAASGIGEATAALFAAEGASLALVDRNQERLQAVASRLSAHGFAVDLGDRNAIKAMVDAAAEALGGLDGVVNAAGISTNPRAPLLEEVTETDWDSLIGINLAGPFFLLQAAIRHLRRGVTPTIVNVSSGTALRPTLRGYSVYAASKGGLLTLSKALAFELAPAVRVNIVCPGSVVTGMMTPEQQAAARATENPDYALRRSAEPIEVARGILYLSCEESSYVTGTTLTIDGGRTFH